MASSARIDELKKKFDENPRRYFAPLANEYRKAGDLEQAIFICQEYLPQQPGHMSGHIVYGQALFEMGRYDEAKVVFETALSLDPENLIALRHLGDIARTAGDTDTARAWYQRVLEADPRNEEIAQLVTSLNTAVPTASQPTFRAPTPPLATPTVPPTPTPAWPQPPAAPEPEQRYHTEPESDALEVEKSTEPDEIGAPALSEPAQPAYASSGAETSSHVPTTETSEPDDDLLDLDEFSLGGIAAADATAPESSVPEMEMPSLAESAAAEAEADEDGFNLGEEEGEFEADPFAIAATPSPAPSIELERPSTEPPIELATDLELGLPDDGTADRSTESVNAIAGLESFESGIAPPPDAMPTSLETDSFYEIPDEPPEQRAGEAAPASADAFEADAFEADAFEMEAPVPGEESVPPAPAFVTETMAELYLEQGHFDAALDIYRELVEQRPSDARLAERMRAVEEQVQPARSYDEPASAPAPSPEMPELEEIAAAPSEGLTAAMDHIAAPEAGGPTIREFLSGILSRRSASNPSESAPNAVIETNAAPEQSEGIATEPTDEPAIDAEVPQRDITDSESARATSEARGSGSTSETVTGSIDALFSGAGASSSDATAANTLAEAFAPEAAASVPLEGVPAHRASSELSLDHVFKANTPARSETEGEGFSFDQFFAEDVGGTSPASGAPSEPDAADDIAQFNAWLNGLKKS